MKKKKTKREFNWLTRLNQLVRRKTPLPTKEFDMLMDRAREWPTCACGQLCKALPRLNNSGAPADRVLCANGIRFVSEVCRQRWRRARHTFRRIEKRSAYLLKEMAS